MGFRFNSDLSLTENARAAWDVKKSVYLTQMERNARLLARKVLPGVDDKEIEFKYDEALYPETPTFDLDDELIAYNGSRKQLALIEICVGCGKQWQWNHFSGIAELGRELTSRDARDPFQCKLCEMVDRTGTTK
jgi:hypothetical protein